jgi:hypothetical protein
LLRDSPDARLTIRRDTLTTGLRIAEGRGRKGMALLEAVHEQARRSGTVFSPENQSNSTFGFFVRADPTAFAIARFSNEGD